MELAGALVPANVKVNPINQSSLSQVKMIGGDYDEGALARVMMGDGIMAGLVASKQKHAPGEKTICFAVNIEHSKAIVAKYNEAGIKALHVDGSFTIEDRNRAFKAFEQGDVEVLVNVGIATYGYDNPSITCVQLVRPTKSLALYLQMVGRGARPFISKDGLKKLCYTILDHANCRIEHGAPDADRKWTLKGKGKAAPSKEDKKVKMIFGDGKERIVSSRELPEDLEDVVLVDMTDGELEAIGRRQKFDKINDRRVRSSYQPMWAYFRFVQEVKDFTLEDLEYIQKKLNFKYGWASFKWKEKEQKKKEWPRKKN
jgi:superfamily II DNA or RNA helicase